jgi:hypothetical protein
VLAAVLAVVLIVGGVVIPRRRAWVAGTARVRSVSPPPAESSHGMLSLEVVIEAPGVPAGVERIYDRAPVAKWPRPGDVLPVLIKSDYPRQVRIRWDEVASRPDPAPQEVDSDQRALRCPSQRLIVGEDGAMATFTVETPEEGFAAPPWLWIRVSQHRRLLQSIELTATGPAER